MKILKFRKFEKNTLRGFIEVELPSGMCIRDLTLHSKNGQRWIGYPARKYEKDDGTTGWMNLIYFPDREVNEKFQQGVKQALDIHLQNEPDNDILF